VYIEWCVAATRTTHGRCQWTRRRQPQSRQPLRHPWYRDSRAVGWIRLGLAPSWADRRKEGWSWGFEGEMSTRLCWQRASLGDEYLSIYRSMNWSMNWWMEWDEWHCTSERARERMPGSASVAVRCCCLLPFALLRVPLTLSHSYGDSLKPTNTTNTLNNLNNTTATTPSITM